MIKIEMTRERSTKGTHVYIASEQDAAIPSLYIKKVALPDDPPARITITVDIGEEKNGQ